MLATYIYAKGRGTEMFIDHDNWQYTVEKGWHDSFTTLKGVDPSQKASAESFWHAHGPPESRDYTVKQYVDGIREVFQPTEEITRKADEFKAQIGGEYTALYVRRGDKVAEGTRDMSLIPTKQILEKCGITDAGQRIFVMTDDYTVVEEVRAALPTSKVYTMCSEKARGSNVIAIRKMDAAARREHMTELIASCIVFKGGVPAWADERSNVGRFLYLYGYPSVKLYPDPKELSEDQRISPAMDDSFSSLR